ncbi:MAG: ABC transporter permease [Acidobacteria bacterium]|nr:ABC transporter permease [Acidobacteriota bacterium]
MNGKFFVTPKFATTLRQRFKAALAWLAIRARLAIGLCILLSFALLAGGADFLAPYDYRAQSRMEPAAPRAAIHWQDAEGNWHLRPFIYARKITDPLTRTYTEDLAKRYPLALLTRGYSYKLCGLLSTNLHLFGLQESDQNSAPRLYILGTDALGRDRLSRMLLASRFSLLVAPLSMLLASLLGIVIGCLAGYSRRWLDALLMRVADAMMALPVLVVVLAARAAFPLALSPARAGVLLVALFVAIGWAEMARLARGEVLALRQRDFVTAAYSLGMTQRRILFRHILPNMSRPLLIQMTLMLPAFLLNETALSYLGVGLQEPEPGWGNMLAAANDLTLLQAQPFELLAPALLIFVFVLGVRLVSDGLQNR